MIFFKRVPNPIHRERKTIFDDNDSERSFYLKHSFQIRDDLTRLLSKIDYNILMLHYQMWESTPVKDIKLHKNNKMRINRLNNMRRRVSRELSKISQEEFRTADTLPGFTPGTLKEEEKRPLTPFQKDVRWLHAQLNALAITNAVPTLGIRENRIGICACSTNRAIDLSKNPQRMFNVWQTLWIISDVISKSYRNESSIFHKHYPIIWVHNHGDDGYQDPIWLISHYSRLRNSKFRIDIDQFLEYFSDGLMDVQIFLERVSFLAFLSSYRFDETLERFKKPLRSRLYEAIEKCDLEFDKYLTDKETNQSQKPQSHL